MLSLRHRHVQTAFLVLKLLLDLLIDLLFPLRMLLLVIVSGANLVDFRVLLLLSALFLLGNIRSFVCGLAAFFRR